ncbi:hypothetical protein SLS63_013662 [Diaporthe eres]|uniref:Uncharacterized protein n=1 Tax=Diaporthe eres TaxID=83184 RepID=A0ABR1NMW0_DIAER
MEAEILRRRTALSMAETQIDEYDSENNIKAIQSIIHLRMSSSMSSKTRSTSSAVSFSILEEEMEILDGLLEHVTGSSKPPNDENGDVLENKLMALPTQLSALFNTEIREVTHEGNDIDEQIMMDMVVENQKRVSVLRHIELVANKVKDVTRNNQDGSCGQQSTCA